MWKVVEVFKEVRRGGGVLTGVEVRDRVWKFATGFKSVRRGVEC